jgi:hypothetical protein
MTPRRLWLRAVPLAGNVWPPIGCMSVAALRQQGGGRP